MITINANTKISALLKQHPDALEAIVSISPKFNKLRNPLLRKLMAPRTSISMASKIGGCTINDFFEKLKPLGFEVDSAIAAQETATSSFLPDFMKTLKNENTVELDVRPVLNEGKDPLHLILEKINELQPQQILKLINTFEPIPLVKLLEKRGFKSYIDVKEEDLVYAYFYKTAEVKDIKPEIKQEAGNWEDALKKYEEKMKMVDVRHLEMPLPMLTILEELEKLANGNALYVYHKRIPVFLIPELKERKCDYRIREISDSEVHLLIFKQ